MARKKAEVVVPVAAPEETFEELVEAIATPVTTLHVPIDTFEEEELEDDNLVEITLVDQDIPTIWINGKPHGYERNAVARVPENVFHILRDANLIIKE